MIKSEKELAFDRIAAKKGIKLKNMSPIILKKAEKNKNEKEQKISNNNALYVGVVVGLVLFIGEAIQKISHSLLVLISTDEIFLTTTSYGLTIGILLILLATSFWKK